MQVLRVLTVLLAISLVAGCSSKFRSYNGPPVTKVIVEKEARKMYLLSGTRILKSYDIGLGFAPAGHKAFEGDGRTPEGNYIIDRRNPNSEFHLSIGINYPSEEDIKRAKALGKDPGGDIFIHGRPMKYLGGGRDWTEGCISVTNREMEDIYAMVRNGTPISIMK